jgi:hypothetical protein
VVQGRADVVQVEADVVQVEADVMQGPATRRRVGVDVAQVLEIDGTDETDEIDDETDETDDGTDETGTSPPFSVIPHLGLLPRTGQNA